MMVALARAFAKPYLVWVILKTRSWVSFQDITIELKRAFSQPENFYSAAGHHPRKPQSTQNSGRMSLSNRLG